MAEVDLVMSDSEFDDDFMMDEDSDFDDFETENVQPRSQTGTNAKKQKSSSAGSSKKTSSKAKKTALNEVSNTINSKSKKKGAKTVEQIYQKKTQLEHILLRPDTYIGSVERITQPMFVLDNETDRIKEKNITFTPGLYKIFDEILVNAADNKQRDESMNSLDIKIDAEANLITVKNNGKGIPVVMHKEHNCYVPTLIFGHLLTGSNFDDSEEKTTGGRNGYGAKLANIFSTKFIVECVDSDTGMKFNQVFHNNMDVADKPTVKNCTASQKKKGDYTQITFSPDLKRFKMDRLDEDTVALLSKRAYDIAGSMANRSGPKLVVTLNGKKLPIRSFESYLKLYDGINPPSAYEQVGDRWEIGVSASDGSFQQVSFVNSISTSKGGQHVNYIADQVANNLVAIVKRKNKGGTEIKASTIKNHLCIFVNCLINNPAFDSQTKENLTTRSKAFGSECTISEKFMKGVAKSGVIDSILAFAKFKQNQALKRQGGTKKTKLTGITKLDDANFSGSAKSKDCTLIITEGDSAKSLAMSGLSVVGRDYYGVFPLKGKPLNVREATHSQILKNEEIKNLVDIMGLKFGTVYDETNIKTLRYGHLMIMADQDHDGSHIKGLVINFIHHFWPSLLDVPGFLQQFITPIVKATKNKGKQTRTFFTLPEYEEWKESIGENTNGWTVKYYKGLGTSTSAEAKEYFSNLDLHEIHFGQLSKDTLVKSNDHSSDEDNVDMDFDDDLVPDEIKSGSDLITMAFAKKQVENRKVWLNKMKQGTYLNYGNAQKGGVSYSDFINRELILFSRADNQRSIAHLLDGFKPSQRKVLFACLKRKLKKEIKVAQLAGYISENSAYHHGEMSLNGTIVGMAQNFVGSNNVNLLTPSGQFGTRRLGGKDSASPRYIFTKLENITRTIFHPDDDALLSYLNDDGLSIEPEYYMPVIPFVLVNGSDGIGTGWSSSLPNYNPRDIISNLRRLIDGQPIEKMDPFYYGFNGTMVAETGSRQGSYVVCGVIERTDDTTLVISELPLKKWTQDYKVFLEGMLTAAKKGAEPDIKDFKENHTDAVVSFTIIATKEKIDSFEKEKNGLVGKFKLSTTLSTSNMNLFDEFGKITKFPSAEAILEVFYPLRLEYYVKRKDLLLKNLRREQSMLSNKARFVEEVCEGDLIVSNRKRKDILADLKNRGYDLFSKEEEEKDDGEEVNEEGSVIETASDAELAKGYEYLLGMKIWSLTFEKAEQLREQLAKKTQEVADLEATPPSQIWKNDLSTIESALDDRDKEMEAAEAAEIEAQSKNSRRQGQKGKKTKTGKVTATATKKKKVSNTKKIEKPKKDFLIDINSDSDEDFTMAKKTSRKPPSKAKEDVAKKKPPKKVTKNSLDLSSDSEDDIFMDAEGSLLERITNRLSITPKKQPSKLMKVQKDQSSTSSGVDLGNKKRPSPRGQAESNPFDESKSTPESKRSKSAAKKAPAKKVTKKTVKKPVGKPKRRVIESESEEEGDSDLEEVAYVAPRARSVRGKKVNYAIEIGSDSDESNFSDSE